MKSRPAARKKPAARPQKSKGSRGKAKPAAAKPPKRQVKPASLRRSPEAVAAGGPKPPVPPAEFRTILLKTLKRGGGGETKTTTDRNGNTVKTEYGESGNIIKITVTNPAGKLLRIVTPTYADGKIVKLTATDVNGVVLWTIERVGGGWIEKHYDAAGGVRSASYTDPLGHVRIYYERRKDANGNWVTLWRFFDDYIGPAHTRSHTEEETRDPNGKLIRRKEESYDLGGSSTLVEEYDDDGKIESSDYEEFENNALTKKVHSWYRKGRLRGRTTTIHRPDGSSHERETEWNENGDKTSQTDTEKHPDGSSTEKTKDYEHGPDGDKIKVTETDYDANGKVTGERSYTIP